MTMIGNDLLSERTCTVFINRYTRSEAGALSAILANDWTRHLLRSRNNASVNAYLLTSLKFRILYSWIVTLRRL